MKISDLIKLEKKAIELFDEYIKEGDHKPQVRSLVRHFTTQLEISENGCSRAGSSEIINKPDWSILVWDFIKERINPLNEFKDLAKSITNNYKSNINKITPNCNEIAQISLWLEELIKKIIYEKIKDNLSEDSLIDHASLFKSELELAPIEYKYKYYLSGLYLEPEFIHINEKVSLRKVKKSDLEYYSEPLMHLPKSHGGISSSILKITLSTQDEKNNFEYINNIFNSLRLFQLGSVLSLESETVRKTVIWSSGKSRGFNNDFFFSFKKYTVKESDIDIFTKFINRIVDDLFFDKNNKKYWSLGISIDRYNSALLNKARNEQRLMISVMGLESLFSLPKERGENAYKLSIRVAKLLEFMNFEVNKVRLLVRKAYNYRNVYVHGLFISEKDRNDMNEILPEILNYLRISIIIFLLNLKIGKYQILNIIDNSMIDPIQNKNLKNLIEKSIKEYKEVLSNP